MFNFKSVNFESYNMLCKKVGFSVKIIQTLDNLNKDLFTLNFETLSYKNCKKKKYFMQVKLYFISEKCQRIQLFSKGKFDYFAKEPMYCNMN